MAGLHVLLVGGVSRSLVNFRGALIRELQARGCQVTAAAGEVDRPTIDQLAEWNVAFAPLPLARRAMNPIRDLVTFASLARLIRRVRPDVFLGYTVKPVVYGLLAARLAGVRRRVAMLEGLGYPFGEGAETRRAIARAMATLSLRTTLPFAHSLIVLNPDDERFFQRGRIGRGAGTVARIDGIGVDTGHFLPAALPPPPVTFLMISRLLRDKGVREFMEAARIVRRAHPDTRFVLLGREDDGPGKMSASDMAELVRDGVVELNDAVADVRPTIASCHVFVLPTAYREGMPRTILEAMSMGRPIITTNAPGCRETVVDGSNGWLVPPRDSPALAAAMMRFAEAPDFIASAGAASLELCRSRFDAKIVVPKTADILLGDAG